MHRLCWEVAVIVCFQPKLRSGPPTKVPCLCMFLAGCINSGHNNTCSILTLIQRYVCRNRCQLSPYQMSFLYLVNSLNQHQHYSLKYQKYESANYKLKFQYLETISKNIISQNIGKMYSVHYREYVCKSIAASALNGLTTCVQ